MYTLHSLSSACGSVIFSATFSVPRGVHSIHADLLSRCSSLSTSLPGVAHFQVMHTSASITAISGEPHVDKDMETMLNEFVPEKWNTEFFQHTYEG